MTTTLRPAEPLQRTEGGARSRRFQVCVNGRAVGTLHLTTDDASFGPAVARVRELHVEERDRGRGRGAVAALAAEEVARSWGCGRIEVSVPATSDAGLGLARALGYTERSRHMGKRLDGGAPKLPPGSAGRPMTAAEYGPWLAHGRERYAQSWITAGVPEDQARARAERDHARLLPDGMATAGTVLTVLEHEGTPVGSLWLCVREATMFVYNVEVAEEYRGRGHGRSLMLLAEAATADAGLGGIGLHVFAGNTPAVGLYTSLGYRATEHHFFKELA
jgi:ribosomal protein S18 acetylase RimI-like enzyme